MRGYSILLSCDPGKAGVWKNRTQVRGTNALPHLHNLSGAATTFIFAALLPVNDR